MVIHPTSGKVSAWQAQRLRAIFDDQRVGFEEDADEVGRENPAAHCRHQQDRGAEFDAEPKALLYPLKQLSTVVKAAHRLKALPKADDHRGGKLRDAGHDGHGSDGGVAIGTCHQVQTDGGKAAQSLPEEGGRTALDDILIIFE